MNTDNENRSEELNESELDNVAGGRAPRQEGDGDPSGAGELEMPEEETPHNPEDDAPQKGPGEL